MKAFVFLSTAMLGISPTLSVAADTANSQKLIEVQSKIRQVDTDIKTLSAEKASLLEQLKKLETQYGELANALNTLKQEIRQQEENLRIVRSKISTTQKSIQAQQHSLEGLIKSAYAIGNQSGLKGVLNQRDPSLSGRMQVYYDYIGKARLQKLLTIQEDYKTLQHLEAEKDQENRLLQVSLTKKQQETEQMQTVKNQREKLLANLNNEYQSKQDQMQNLVSDEKKLTTLVASLQKTDDNADKEATPSAETVHKQRQQPPVEPEPSQVLHNSEPAVLSNWSFEKLQGQLPWPVQGAIIDRFGTRRAETRWDGTVIHAREGADIHAIAPGRVIYADWLGGYGLMLIVDHGKGYWSLYAFNQSLRKNVGDRVAIGETLASVGHSGGRSQAALYFGIRKNGKSVNPEHWCRKPAQN